MAKKTTSRKVSCYLCGHCFEVGARAMSTSCPGCNRPVVVGKVTVSKLEAVKRIQTCGTIVVEKKGRVIADLVEAHGDLIVHGHLQATVRCRGEVVMKKKSVWNGDCFATALHIERGAKYESGQLKINPTAATDDPPTPKSEITKKKATKKKAKKTKQAGLSHSPPPEHKNGGDQDES